MKINNRYTRTVIYLAIMCGGCWVWGYQSNHKVEAYEVPVQKTIDVEQTIASLRPEIDPGIRASIATAVNKYAEQYKLDPGLVVAVMARESSFEPLSISKAKCIGLMQINPLAHKEKVKGIAASNLYHIDRNIQIGCEILSQYVGNSKTYRAALYRYVGAEYKRYADDILSLYGEIQLSAR